MGTRMIMRFRFLMDILIEKKRKFLLNNPSILFWYYNRECRKADNIRKYSKKYKLQQQREELINEQGNE